MNSFKTSILFALLSVIFISAIYPQSLNDLKGYEDFNWEMNEEDFLAKAKAKYIQKLIRTVDDTGYGFIDYELKLEDGAIIYFRFLRTLYSVTVCVADERAFIAYFNNLKKKYGNPVYKKYELTENWFWNGRYTVIEAMKSENSYSFFYTSSI